MKKFTYLATMLLVMAGAVSCEKKAEVKEPAPQPTGIMRQVTISAGQAAEKTSVSGGTLTWSEGDKLNIVPTTGSFDAVALEMASEPGGASATFQGSIDSGIADDTPLYGWAGGAWAYKNGAFTIEMTDAQTYVENGLAENAYPSIGKGTIAGGISLSNPFGVLCLNVIGDDTQAVKSIKVTSAEKNLAGKFTIDPSETPALLTEGSSKAITLTCTTAVALATTGVKFYIVVPAASYAANDLTVTITKSDDTTFDFKLGTTIITAGSSTLATQTTGYAYASAVDGYVKWTQLWAGGPRFAEYNVGATSLGAFGEHYPWGSSSYSSDATPAPVSTDIQYDETYDTARKLWGDNWQMFNYDDLLKLLNKYGSEPYEQFTDGGSWVENYESTGSNGYLFTGIGDYSGNSIFLPAAGLCSYPNPGFINNGIGYYWGSTPWENNPASSSCMMGFSKTSPASTSFNSKSLFHSVRAVLAERVVQ